MNKYHKVIREFAWWYVIAILIIILFNLITGKI